MTTNKQAVVKQLEAMLSELADVDGELTKKSSEYDVEIKAITDKYAPIVDPLAQSRSQLVDQISQLFQDNRSSLIDDDGKSVTLRSGTLTARTNPLSITIYDEAAAMKYAKRSGMLTKVTKVGKRTFVKDKLKKFVDFVNKAPGLRFEQHENLIIKLPRTQVEITRELNPLRKRLD